MKKQPIELWRFKDAPQKYQELSSCNGDDADWLVFIPNEFKDAYLPFFEEGSSFGVCTVETIPVFRGIVKIGYHS